MKEIKERILTDIELTEKYLNEDVSEMTKYWLRLWLAYDYELLSIIKSKGE